MLEERVFRSASAEFVYVRSYSRWLEDQGRRETWPETVDRFVSFIKQRRGDKVPAKVIRKIEQYLLSFSVMPSMRALWAAGPAADSDDTTCYNCAFRNIDDISAFSEALYILMCGTGFGFKVTLETVAKLPTIPDVISVSGEKHSVEDSKAGWADSLKFLIKSLYAGKDPEITYEKVRPAGQRLKTMGGRASGPAPLIRLHQFVRDTFYAARGRQLNTLECHDIMCQIAEIVVVGGVRRSSEISISSLHDELMRNAKSGNFPIRRYMANNSALYEAKPTAIQFLNEWNALAASGRGERGIFNLEAARKMAPKRRDASLIEGFNPCAEILLRNRQFCNLSEVVVRPDDDLDSLLDKVECATWVGCIQSTFTNFPYLSKEWKDNCEKERLLGVSITGQMDAPHLLTEETLRALKARARKTAKKAAEILEINEPTAITCTKPSGSVAQTVVCGAGLHRHRGRFICRRYRINATDPLMSMLKDQGIKMSPENGQRQKDWNEANRIFDKANHDAYGHVVALQKAKEKCSFFDLGKEWDESMVNTWVVSFPIKAPDTALTLENCTAIEQLEWYKKIQTNWCEHNASCTINVKDSEWFEVGNWVYNNWDIVNGISFLPHDGGKYEQLPEEAITEEEYEQMVKRQKPIDYSQLSRFEMEDSGQGSKESACSGSQSCGLT